MAKQTAITPKFAFVGCGVIAESMVAGMLAREIVTPAEVVVSHPRAARRTDLSARYGVTAYAENADAVQALPGDGTVVICVKPQRAAKVLADISEAVGQSRLVVSIVAGARIETITDALSNRHVVRVMPNTPSQIGSGMTVWTCSKETTDEQRARVATILSALGKELFVETENMVDMATSLSATGPTFTFMVMEALTDAGVHLGFSRETAKELVLETMLGSVQFAMKTGKHPAELRNMVTSPGGTSAEAIYQMEKGGLRTVLSKAVYAAYRRAVQLGSRDPH